MSDADNIKANISDYVFKSSVFWYRAVHNLHVLKTLMSMKSKIIGSDSIPIIFITETLFRTLPIIKSLLS